MIEINYSTVQERFSPTGYELRGSYLTIEEIVAVACDNQEVVLTCSAEVLDRIRASRQFVDEAVAQNQPIYGVTTGFGGMANIVISAEDAASLQNNMLWCHRTGAGNYIPLRDVRAAMLLRANSLAQGASGIRLEIIERMVRFLNAGITPLVREYGSIGASGDLVPLTIIAGCIIGADESFRVDMNGTEMGAVTALREVGLAPIRLQAKEALALLNGTSVMAGIAANCVAEAQQCFRLAIGVHALLAQGLYATNQSFYPFAHTLKPHAGQKRAASDMLNLLEDSLLIRDELDGRHDHREGDLIQDRYSLRCLPQYLGPIYDGFQQIARQIETEASSVSDNPLIDVENGRSYHCGNFLGQYVGVSMDQLRYYIGLIAKHLDAQIALLVAPEFNNGLSPSLVGNTERSYNMGLKGLQISINSMMPLLSFYGNSLADRFPTHAEQFNQNINSQGYGSANLTRESLKIFTQYLAGSLIFGVQGVDLRTKHLFGHYDARATLSPASLPLYNAVYDALNLLPSADFPFVWNDDEQFLDIYLEILADNILNNGSVMWALDQATAVT